MFSLSHSSLSTAQTAGRLTAGTVTDLVSEFRNNRIQEPFHACIKYVWQERQHFPNLNCNVCLYSCIRFYNIFHGQNIANLGTTIFFVTIFVNPSFPRAVSFKIFTKISFDANFYTYQSF